LIAVVPVYVLSPESVSVPAPSLRRPPVPPIGLLIAANPITVTVGVVPPKVRRFVPATVITPVPELLNVMEFSVNGPMSLVAV